MNKMELMENALFEKGVIQNLVIKRHKERNSIECNITENIKTHLHLCLPDQQLFDSSIDITVVDTKNFPGNQKFFYKVWMITRYGAFKFDSNTDRLVPRKWAVANLKGQSPTVDRIKVTYTELMENWLEYEIRSSGHSSQYKDLFLLNWYRLNK